MKTLYPPAMLSQHIAVLGKTGSGKTYAAKGLVENLLSDGRQVCVLDPTSAWWGLRLAADGKRAGFDVVLIGGTHGDIPLAERSGAAVARLVTEQGVSCVIDTGGFTVGEYTRWFIDFAGTLYTTIKNPLHLVIDEAHHFMPQGKTPDVDAGRMLHAGNRLMSGGRSKGLRGLLITQRPAKLHKDSLTCADALIAMRVIAPQDRAAIKEWIDGAGDPAQGKEVLDSLAQLQRGEGWIWYPEGGFLSRVKFPAIRSYDSSATPTHGEKAGPKVSEIDLTEVRAALAAAVKEAEANDPKLLRQRIAELERAAKSKQPAAADSKAIDRAVATAVAARDREWQTAIKDRERVIGDFKGRLGKIANLAHVNGEAVVHSAPPAKVFTNQVRQTAAAPAKTVYQPRKEISGDSTFGKAERQILTAFYWLRDEEVTPAKVGFYSDYSASSGGFNNTLGKLRSAGLLSGWKLTEAGETAASGLGASVKPSGSKLREWLRRKLGKAENAILDALAEAYPNRLTTAALGEASGYSSNSGGFNNALGRLRSIEAAEGYERDGGVKASSVFFE